MFLCVKKLSNNIAKIKKIMKYYFMVCLLL